MPSDKSTPGRKSCPHCSKSVSTAGGGLANHIIKVHRDRLPTSRRSRPGTSSNSSREHNQRSAVPQTTSQAFAAESSRLAPLDTLSGSTTNLAESNHAPDYATAGISAGESQNHGGNVPHYTVQRDERAGWTVPNVQAKSYWEAFDTPEFHSNHYYPWKDESEWNMVRWLSDSCTQVAIDAWLKLEAVSAHAKLCQFIHFPAI